MMKVSRAFAAAFAKVHEAFRTSPAEIDEAKAIARARMVAAEDAYYADAAMIGAGWDPLVEQAAAFIKRTGFVLPSRDMDQPAHVEIQWPEKQLRRAA